MSMNDDVISPKAKSVNNNAPSGDDLDVVVADYNEALKFLKQLRAAPWVLTAIIPDGKTTTETFNDCAQARAFIRHHNGNGSNIYYSVNPTRTEMQKKATKSDIEAAEYLWVDADPRDGETKSQCRRRIDKLLKEYPRQPTFKIDSGNGIQLLWDLRERVPLTPDAVADIEARNHALAIAFGAGPETRNVDRILRLPGTLNYPNAKKRKDGRQVERARVLGFLNKAHKVAAFAPYVAPAEPVGKAGAVVADTPSALPKATEALLYMPSHEPYGSRSELLFGFLTAALKAGVSHAEITDLCAHSAGAIAKHIADQPNKGYLQRQIARAQKKVPTGSKSGPKDYELVRASDIVIRNPDWLWKGHLARSEMEMLSGETGIGKSQVQAHMVACATTKLPWPDGARNERGPMNVVMVVAEDCLESTIVPRLKLAGADVERVQILKMIKQDEKRRMFIVGEDLEVLEDIRRRDDVGLFTLDPITAYLGGGKFNPNSTTDVRAQLGPLQDFAHRNEVAVSTITHPSKSGGGQATDQFIHSGAFIAAVRIGHLCVAEIGWHDGNRIKTGRNLFTTPKHSLSAEPPALAYTLEEDQVRGEGRLWVETCKVVWGETVELSANDAVERRRDGTRTTKVDEWLKNHLADGGKHLRNEIVKAAKGAGFSYDQLNGARGRIRADFERAKDTGLYSWWLPKGAEK